MVFFAVQKLLSLIRYYLFIFVFIFITLGAGSKRISLQFKSKSVLPVFSSKSFVVSSLMFRSLIHFIFVFGVRECSDFIFLHVVVQFSQHHLLKRLFFCFCFFTIVFSFLLCHRLDVYMCLSLSLGSLSCSIDVCFSFCASTSVLMTVAL